jgi:hypothetical protein
MAHKPAGAADVWLIESLTGCNRVSDRFGPVLRPVMHGCHRSGSADPKIKLRFDGIIKTEAI